MSPGIVRRMREEDTSLICVRCGRPVERNRDTYEVFERMHWACFHYEFEHEIAGSEDPDIACANPCCPRARVRFRSAASRVAQGARRHFPSECIADAGATQRPPLRASLWGVAAGDEAVLGRLDVAESVRIEFVPNLSRRLESDDLDD